MAVQQSDSAWAWGTAERGLKRVVDLSPGYATTHHLYSLLLARLGRFDEAISHAERALGLDPFSPVMTHNPAYVLYLARHYDEAIQQAHKTLEMAPDLVSARLVLVSAYSEQQRLQERCPKADETRSPWSL